MHETGHSKPVHGDNPVGWDGRREGGSGRGTHVHPWLIHVKETGTLLKGRAEHPGGFYERRKGTAYIS